MKDYKEEDFLQLSGIQHFKFCRRQWALIHIEYQWQENEKTISGELLHEKVHNSTIKETRKNIIISRAMPVKSYSLGISGECDAVEFIKDEDGVEVFGKQGRYNIYPVEYKRGKPKKDDCDISQLVAQAMCLEEMFCCKIDKGFLYYGETRHRQEILITEKLKQDVMDAFEDMHEYVSKQYTPKVKEKKCCNSCSLKNVCIPVIANKTNVKSYINEILLK